MAEVHNHLPGFSGVEGEVVSVIPFCQSVDLISVGCVIFLCDEAYQSGVIGKLNDGVAGVSVICVDGVRERAQQTALW